MRPVSLARQRENYVRRQVIAALYDEQPFCARCGEGKHLRDLDGHEVLSRARGGSITDADNIRLLCRPCHDVITVNPDLAVLEGWTKHSWETS